MTEDDADDAPPKPPPSFNGALSKFLFCASKAHIPAQSKIQPTKGLPKKRPAPDPNPPPKKKIRRKHTGYALPSAYAHLSPIPDVLSTNLICIFIGINPGLASATAGHAFASPTNLFWRLLHSSGCTPDRRLPPEMDVRLPELYSLGHTNLVGRPSRDAGELSKEEMVGAVPALEGKLRRWRPESVCIVGKTVWEAIWRSTTGRPLKKDDFDWGWQEQLFAAEHGWEGCRVFVVPSTSGLVAAYSTEFKTALWKVLGDWVQEQRKHRETSVT